MAAKISDRLALAIEGTPAPTGPLLQLHVLLKDGLSQQTLEQIAARVGKFAKGEIQVIPIANIILASVPPSAVPKIAAIEGVEWIDRESVAPMESLLDSRRAAGARRQRRRGP